MVKALGEDKAKQVLDMIEEESFRSHHSPVIDKLRDIDPRVLIDFTKMEHPQTIALILAHLRPEQTAEILENLPEEKQTDITRRIATLNSVPGEFIEEMEKALESELILGETGEQSFGGVDLVADILNKMNRSSENAILESLDETNPDLSAEIRELMFTFDDVLQLDDRAIRELLQEVSSEDLALAIKVADESMQEKVFKNMSKRAADMLREDIELMPPTRLSVIEESQKRIVETTKRLESEGKITVVTGAGEDKLV
jgi:flagellar motor switch protein FliG